MKVYVLIQLSGNEIDYVENVYLSDTRALEFLQRQCADGYQVKSVAYDYDVFGTLTHEYAPIYATTKSYTLDDKLKVFDIHWQLLEFEVA